MSLLQLPTEVLSDRLACFLDIPTCLAISTLNKRLRSIFFPLLFRTIDTGLTPISQTLQILESSPDVASHVKELILTQLDDKQDNKQDDKTITACRKLLHLVGPNLQSLSLYYSFVPKNSMVQGMRLCFLALRLCQHLKFLDVNLTSLHEKWWNFESKEMEAAVGGFAKLEGLSLKYSSYNKNRLQSIPPLFAAILQKLRPGQLTKRLLISMNLGEGGIVTLFPLIARQNRIKFLELDFPYFAEKQLVLAAKSAANIEFDRFCAFDQLETLHVTALGFFCLDAVIDYSQRLRHLRVTWDNWAKMDVFARFSAATVSNFWSRLESFELSMEFNVSCGLGTQVFHFLGGQYSPRHFKLSCHSNQSLNQENVNFGDIIRSLIPNTNLRSIDIQFKMDESSLLLLSNFLSNCENLEEVRLNLESPYSQDDTKILQFLADVALLPNLAILVVPFPISSAGLHDLERTLSFRRSKRFIQELWLLADIGTSLLDALPRFLDSQANLGFLAIGVPCETHFSASAIRFFDWIASSQPRNLKSFTLHTLKLPYMGVTSLRPYHEQVQQCYPALESLLSTCKFLELMCICGIRITDVERGMMERVRITRKRNGLKQLNFEIQS